MLPITSRSIGGRFQDRQFQPYRQVRPVTSKIIFLSMEGCVTEEEYFMYIPKLFNGISSKIQFISVAEDEVRTIPKRRTFAQNQKLSMVRPKQLVERIEQFKTEKEDIYQFSQYPDDEFWIVTDVDKNWSSDIIDNENQKSYKDEWEDAVSMCQEKGYGYAISNPFFEIWLLLHHDEVTDEDKCFAVTDEHEYEKTDHFKTRLRDLGSPLKKKSIDIRHYNTQNVRMAINRAESLHIDKKDMYPKYLSTTVYVLMNKMMEMLPQQDKE